MLQLLSATKTDTSVSNSGKLLHVLVGVFGSSLLTWPGFMEDSLQTIFATSQIQFCFTKLSGTTKEDGQKNKKVILKHFYHNYHQVS